MNDEFVMDPAIDHALSVYPPEIAHRASRVIRSFTGQADIRRHRSRLTGDGFPFELAFSTAEPDQLRFTVEPSPAFRDGAGSEYSGDRLQQVRRFLSMSGLATPDDNSASILADDVWSSLAEMQRGRPLTYGAWLGARFGCQAVSAKIYAEVPAGVPLPTFCPPGPRLADGALISRMIGYTPAAGILESYFRIPSLEPEQLANVFAPAHLRQRASSTLEFVESLYGYRIRGRLLGPSVGISYASLPEGQCITLYLFARSLWGSDARIRRSFAQFAGQFGPNLERYLAVSAPVASRESWKTYHGLVGLSFSESRDGIAIGIGLRPIAPHTGSFAP